MENHRPFTLNKQYLNIKEECVTTFALMRHGRSSSGLLPCATEGNFKLTDASGNPRTYPASEENLVTVLSAYGIHLSSLKQLSRIHEDEYDAELDVISHVTAYFDVSSKRIIDDIPKLFETIFALDFGQELEKHLAKNLKLVEDGGVGTCKRYIRDEPDIQSKRDDLSRHHQILKTALDTVDGFFK
jgi:Dynamin GTPase effector domain